ncbi:MFS transporter [Streptomyces fragilis]|uniref:MFS transporter n=1 Tax=Streptomyces fragilis TaxID=67301 RepID=A0ABV2YNA8_9ACTN|nr:MFS transporter [Streptomyces fragilis]
MFSRYLEILKARHAARLLTGTLVGRLPNATSAIAIVLFVRAEGGSYSLAGVLAAVYGVANAVGQPVLGRLVDLHGQPRVQLPAAVLAAASMAVFAVTGLDPLPVAYLATAGAGLFTPPLEGGLRALWPSVLRRDDQIHTAYAMDAVAQEVMFTVGPLLVSLFVALWSPMAALLALNAIGVLGALSVVLSPPSRAWRSAPREAHWLGALRSGGLLVLLGALFFVGIALGSITVAAAAYADRTGPDGDAVYAVLLAALGFGALVGGGLYGAREWAGAPERRLKGLVAALALGYLPLIAMPAPAPMTLLAALAGVFLAPTIACAFVLVDRHAPRGTVTEAFSWLVTTFTVGSSVGTGIAGPVLESLGTRAGFAVPAVAGTVSLAVLLASRGVLARPRNLGRVAAGSENDPNRTVEPRFSSGDRA